MQPLTRLPLDTLTTDHCSVPNLMAEEWVCREPLLVLTSGRGKAPQRYIRRLKERPRTDPETARLVESVGQRRA